MPPALPVNDRLIERRAEEGSVNAIRAELRFVI
jgi:hypothetical protein